MRVSLSWLAEWIELPEVSALAEQLTMAGLEVDAIERSGPDLSPFRVGHVVECGRHPGADRLWVARVDVAEAEPLQIVCGAPNLAEGQKVAVALPGTRLANGTKLKRSKLRGVESQGMICAEDELGLGDDHTGIVVLAADAPLGAPLDTVLAAGETVLDVAVLPNRGDCLSMLGMAREVRALFGGEIRAPETHAPESGPPAQSDASVVLEAPEACHAYVAHVVRGLRIGPSPDWVARKLEAAGLRPIDVVVDVTNLVLLEFGQPLHAFDLARLRGGKVRVRLAAEGETLVTLDGAQRTLTGRDLVIADAERAIGIAGVMGGANTEVEDTTTDILLEAAHFSPAFIRHTGRRLGLFTEASVRFERGIDARAVRRAADRAARLLAELAGGSVAAGPIEVSGSAPEHTLEVELDPARVNRLLGIELPAAEVAACLERVGVSCAEQGGRLRCRIPSHRNDLAIPEDLIEEVARIHGYQKIPPTPLRADLEPGERPARWVLADRVRDALVADGLVELLTVPFVEPGALDALGIEADDPRRRLVRVVNPLVESESHLRSSLLASLLRVVRENLARQVDRLAVFEVARTYRAKKDEELPEETLEAAGAMIRGEGTGPWEDPERVPLFFEAKGVVERLLARLGREAGFRAEAAEPYLHPGTACSVLAGGQEVGILGGLHPDTAGSFEIGPPCVIFELDLERIHSLPEREVRYREVSSYPSVRRDLSLLVDEERPAGELLEAIRRRGGADLRHVELFDRYAGKGVPQGRVSLAFRLTFQRVDRTLTDPEVSERVERIVRTLSERFGATLR